MQKEQLQGSIVMPVRHVWLQITSTAFCTQLTNNLDHSASSRTKQDLNYRDSTLLCTILSGIWRYIVHFLFCNYLALSKNHCFDTQKTQWKQLTPTSHLLDLTNLRKWYGFDTSTDADFLWQLNNPWHKKQAIQFSIFLKDFIPLISLQ